MSNPKLTKGALKEIVKECLIELLAEGLSGQHNDTVKKSTKNLKEGIDNSSRSKRHPSYLNSINFKDKKTRDNRKNNKLNDIASNVTDDPILSELLMDTAHTTLQEQIAAENKKSFIGSGQGDNAQRIVESSEPAELFGDASNKWASLAFGN